MFRFKGHYGTEWTEYRDYYYSISSDNYFHYSGFFNASESEYTIAELRGVALGGISDGAEIDIQVRALMGHIDQIPYWTYMGDGYSPKFFGEMSDWSGTHTINIASGKTTVNPTEMPIEPTPTPTTNPTTPTSVPTVTPQDSQGNEPKNSSESNWELVVIVGLVVAVVVLAVGLGVVWRKLSLIKGSPVGQLLFKVIETRLNLCLRQSAW